MKLENISKAEIKSMKRLYKSAFPKAERKPFWLILKQQKKGIAQTLSILGDDGELFGLLITLQYKDMVLIDYFAVDESSRGKGVGSKTLELIKEKYKNKRIFLEIEAPDVNAENSVQREKRKTFYLRNGFVHDGICVKIYGNNMEILTFNGSVNFSEYCDFLTHTLGRIIEGFLNPQVINGEVENS